MKELLKALLLILVIVSSYSEAVTLYQKENLNFSELDYYLVDIEDNGVFVSSSIDAYVVEDEFYIALTPLFEGLRLKYTLTDELLVVTHAGKTVEVDLSEQSATNSAWFNDGAFIFLSESALEELLATNIDVNLNLLKANLHGHTADFPHKKITSNQQQRQKNNVIFDTDNGTQVSESALITIPDEYRLATAPSGYFKLDHYQNQDRADTSILLRAVGDLAYHSSDFTWINDDSTSTSRLRLSRYPTEPGKKILGLLDQYSFGDVFVTGARGIRDTKRGLGFSASSNYSELNTDNMRTNFIIEANPGWDADVFHNGIYIETRVVPEDGVMEFNEVELFYGNNEFKIVLFGPYGEEVTEYKTIKVDRSPLSKGALSFNFSFIEQDSSLFDIDTDLFNIDQFNLGVNVGVTNNWNVGVAANLIRIDNTSEIVNTFNITNRLSLPGWLFENNLIFSEDRINQRTTAATSFFNNDSFIAEYNSVIKNDADSSQSKPYDLSIDYHFKTNPIVHSFNYKNNFDGVNRQEDISYRLAGYFSRFSFTNSISYRTSTINEEQWNNSLLLTSRLTDNIRIQANIPYDFNEDDVVNSDNVQLTFSYYLRNENYSTHRFSLNHNAFSEQQNWSAGYNYAINNPHFRFVFGSRYNSGDNWSVTAGIEGYFGYDYYNNKMQFSSSSLTSGGSLDIHAYLDRQLNGVPDVLDYSLPDVTFSGKDIFANVRTNENGRARVIGSLTGLTPLRAEWKSGSQTLRNDYLIYSHPGAQQHVNLPFYLTTEIELFTLFANGDEISELRNVPIVAKNITIGEEYSIESDVDGYVTLVGLLPGEYEIQVDQNYLEEKGYTADIKGFKFDSPMTGGFVILPNITLSRLGTGEVITNSLKAVELTEDNYIPLLYSDDDKLVHLPPKGAFTTPYTRDKLHLAKFKQTKTQIAKEQRQVLRDSLAKAKSVQRLKRLQVATTSKQSLSLANDQDTKVLYVGSFKTRLEAQQAARKFEGTMKVVEGLDRSGKLVYRFEIGPFPSAAEAEEHAIESFPTQSYRVESAMLKVDLSKGWVVQYAATKELAAVSTLAQKFADVEHLHVVRKRVNDQYWYCLVSRVFSDKSGAELFLSTAEEDGFIVDVTKFLDTVWSK